MELDDLLGTAEDLARAGTWQEALAQFEEVLERDPSSCRGHYGRAFCSRQLSDYESAAESVEALGLCPDYAREALFEGGALKHLDDRFDEALTDFDQALLIDPGYENALVWRVTTLRRLERWTDAEQRSSEAVAVQPASARLWVERGWVFYDQERYDDAGPAFDKALEVDPEYEDALLWRVTVQRLVRRFDEAEQHSEEAVQARPGSAALWVERGWVFSDQQRNAEALAAFEQALEVDPEHENALVWRIRALRRLKRWDEAEKRSLEAVEAHPGRAALWVERGWVFTDQKRYEDAIPAFEEALQQDPESDDALVWRITAVRLARHWAEAEQRSQDAVQAHPDIAALWVERGWVFFDQKRYDEALPAFEKALEVDPASEDALRWRIRSLRRLKRWQEADQHADEATTTSPDSAAIWVERGLVLVDQKRYDDAIPVFDRALQLDPGSEDALVWRVTAERLARRWNEAERRSLEAVDAHPDNAALWVERGWVFYDQKRYDDALPAFEKALQVDPDYENALVWRVTVQRLARRWDEADRLSAEAVKNHPDSAPLWIERGWVFFDRERYDEALAPFERALQIDPGDETALAARINTLRQARRWTEAEQRSFDAVQAYPDSAALWVERGWVFSDQDRYDDALAAFARADEAEPDSADVDTSIGAVAFDQERYEEAELKFRSALAKVPDDDISLTNLAWAILRLGDQEKLSEAASLCRSALSTNPSNAAAYNCLGVVAYQQGRLRLSESHLKRAFELSTDDKGYTPLGALYLQMGRYSEAEKQLRGAIESDWYDEVAHVELGALLDQVDQPVDAFREFDATLKLNPNNVDAIQGAALAKLHAGEAGEAESLLRDGLRQADTVTRYPLSLLLARVLIERGDSSQRESFYSEALTAAVDSLQLRPNEPLPYFYAGIARFKMGELTDALQQRLAYRSRALKFFEKCIERDPDNIEAIRNADLVRQSIRRSQGTIIGGTVLAVLSLTVLLGLWLGFFLSTRVTSVMVTTLTPVLVGLVLLSFLLPVLSRVKLPGLEADLRQDAGESVASGPTGGIDMGELHSPLRTGLR